MTRALDTAPLILSVIFALSTRARLRPHGARNRYRAVSVRRILALLVIGWDRWCRTRALDSRCVKSVTVRMVGGDWVALRLA
ncbi:hypothetical protein B0H14DRAFT_3055082, partial [Mycena olivaceomarginata]